MKRKIVGLIVIISVFTVFSRTYYLVDVANFKNGVYYINKNLTVNSNDSLYIGRGSKIAFVGMVGINVYGTVIAKGKHSKEIIFCSVNELHNTGTGFDWLGINVKSNGLLCMEHCIISNATEGIKTKLKNNIKIKSTVFKNNGQWDICLNGEPVQINNNKLVYYNVPIPKATPQKVEVIKDVVKNTQKYELSTIPKRIFFLYPVAMVCIGASAVFTQKALFVKETYDDFRPGNKKFDKSSSVDIDKEFARIKKDLYGSSIFAGISGIAGISLGVYGTVFWINF